MSLLLAVPNPGLVWHSVPSCLSLSFRGLHGNQAIFRPTGSVCVNRLLADSDFNPSVVVPVPEANEQLVWLQESAVDAALRTPAYDAEVDDFFQWLYTGDVQNEYQATFRAPAFSLLHRDPTLGTALVAVADDAAAHTVSDFLPRYWKASVIPRNPVPLLPVPEQALEHIRDLLATSYYDPLVATIVDGISIDGMRDDVRYLTNEDGASGIESRSSFTHGARVAAQWLKAQFEKTGATCELKSFSEGFAPNVVCKYAGTMEPRSIVLISAHYDSRGSFGSSRAPGANDDGSGIVSLLAIARRIKELRLSFHTSVELVAFAGEEQGLIGSAAYARELRERDANVTLMVQADMLAYHVPGEPPQLGLPKEIGSHEVAMLVTKMAEIYSPELTVGYTTACCSDHMSFHEQGYPSTQVFERAGPIADPMYHNSRDLSERPGFDLQQVQYISKVQFAAMLQVAGFELPEMDN